MRLKIAQLDVKLQFQLSGSAGIKVWPFKYNCKPIFNYFSFLYIFLQFQFLCVFLDLFAFLRIKQNSNTMRLLPEVQPLTLLYTLFDRKRTPLTEEHCIPFNYCKYTVFNIWINIGNSMICSDIWHKNHEYSDISKLLYVILRAVRRVKFGTILKYDKWYLCQISRTNHAIICLYYYPQKVCNFHM